MSFTDDEIDHLAAVVMREIMDAVLPLHARLDGLRRRMHALDGIDSAPEPMPSPDAAALRDRLRAVLP